jgi:uncharacterized protein YcgI (DUF1989 family)
MRKIFQKIIPPKAGLAVEVKRTQHLRVIDIDGKQVVDTIIFNLHNLREKLSTSWSRQRKPIKVQGKYESSDMVVEGDCLKSTLCRPLMTIVKETAEPKGVHSVHGRMCNRWLYEAHGVGSRDGCFEILSKVVFPYGILPEDIPDAICFNMNFIHYPDEHRWAVKEPVSRAGDYVELRAEIDCLVAMSNCPEDILSLCNSKHCTSIKIEIYEQEE